MNYLTKSELDRLQKLEATIKKGKQAFFEVGNALLEIRETKLYKQTHGTFAKYVEDKFGFTAQHAGRICSAAAVAPVLEPIGSIPTESQAREVAKAPKEKQAEVVDRAVEIAADRGKRPTAAIIAEARTEVMAELPELQRAANATSINEARTEVMSEMSDFPRVGNATSISEALHDVPEAATVDDEYEDVDDGDDGDGVVTERIAEIVRDIMSKFDHTELLILIEGLRECVNEQADAVNEKRPPRHDGENMVTELFAMNTADVALTQLKGIPAGNCYRDAAMERVLNWIASQRKGGEA